MKTQDVLSTILAFFAVAASANPVNKRLPSTPQSKHLRFDRRDEPGYAQGQPIDGKGKGAPISGPSLSLLKPHTVVMPLTPSQAPRIHRRRRRQKPQMALLRLQNPPTPRRLGPRTSHHRPARQQRHRWRAAAPDQRLNPRTALAPRRRVGLRLPGPSRCGRCG
jgi:hypothetical protein